MLSAHSVSLCTSEETRIQKTHAGMILPTTQLSRLPGSEHMAVPYSLHSDLAFV